MDAHKYMGEILSMTATYQLKGSLAIGGIPSCENRILRMFST